LENQRYFGRDQVYGFPDDTERFLYFSRAALAACEPLGWCPDVVHCNDWHTAIIPHWMHAQHLGNGGASVITVHNLAYQGAFDPAKDPAIAQTYSVDSVEGKEVCKLALQREAGFDANPRTPLVGIVGRLADQKGFDLIAQVIEPLLAELDFQVVLLGTGELKYHELIRQLAAHNRPQLAAYLTFDAALAQRIYAGSDMFLMPSRFEPCGLGQLISLRYGTVPVVRATGGLADTVTDYQPTTRRGTGFVFRLYDSVSLVVALSRALEMYRQPDRWREIQEQGMRQDVSWGASARRYVDAYRDAIRFHEAE